MDWLTLLFLVPLIVIPIVFLTGFAGCRFNPVLTPPPPPPPAPFDLVITEVGIDRIDLEWTDSATNTTSFRIARRENSGAPVSLPLIPATPGVVQIHHTDLLLKAATTYEYQVFALNLGGESAQGSNTKSGTTLFAAFGENQGNWANDCMVQRINAGNLFNSGEKVQITLRGSTTNELRIERAYISQAAAPPGTQGVNDWDSAGVVTQLKFGANDGVLLPAGTSVLSNTTDYPLDHTKDLLIAFDIGNQGGARRGPKPGCRAYRATNTNQAARPGTDRSSNFTPEMEDTVYLIEKIEVFP